MVIVDTTVWIDSLRGEHSPQSSWLERELPSQRLGILDLILCEVLQGISDERQFENTLTAMLKLTVYQTGGVEMATSAARNFQSLRKGGFTVRKTVDCWIATFCIMNGHTLLHNDRDFQPFEAVLGLKVLHP